MLPSRQRSHIPPCQKRENHRGKNKVPAGRGSVSSLQVSSPANGFTLDLPPTQDASHHQEYSIDLICHCYWGGGTTQDLL